MKIIGVGRWVRPVLEILEGRQLLSTITVNSSGDGDLADGSNTLSLRQAIEINNGSLAIGSLTKAQAALVTGQLTSPNTINFAIPGSGPFIIAPSTNLPTINDAVVIDGYSEPGSHPNTNGLRQGKNTVLQIELDGAKIGFGSTGLNLLSNGSTVEGLAIGGFGTGISIGSIMGDINSNLVEGNFIGTDVSGTQSLANSEGIAISYSPFGSGGSDTIGGTTAGAGNLISGNTDSGVLIGDSCVAQGNFIGTDVTGFKSLPNGQAGIIPATFTETFDSDFQTFSAENDTIGGTSAGAGNLISGNFGIGVFVLQSVQQNNFIGVDVTGTFPLANADDGGAAGVGSLTSATVTGSSTLITGSLNASSSTSYTINFYSSTIPNPDNVVEGTTFVGSTLATTDASGHASFSIVSAQNLQGQILSATAIDPNGNTLGFPGIVTPQLMTTTELVGPGPIATLGRSTTFAAVVTASSGAAPVGVVNFFQDGVMIGAAPLNASGVAVFITQSLAPGSHTIAAAYAADQTHAASLSNAVPILVFDQLAFGGPAVTSVKVAGSNLLTIDFNRGLLAGPAQDPTNYQIVGPEHRSITVTSAVYDPKFDSVTLTTMETFVPGQTDQLTINGEQGDRIVDVFGIPLNGRKNGKPGHDYVGKIAVKKNPVVKVAHPASPKTKAQVSHAQKAH